jgi:hemerythrin superfamily protein
MSQEVSMSIIDKVVAAVTPMESDDARREARAKAKSAARPGDWLSMVLQHHEHIEAAFAAVKSASTAATRAAAQKRLGIILTGHSNAEESVIYPALTTIDEKSHATAAYTEQAAAKTQMALLESLAPMTQEYLDKLEHIRGAVAHHVYEEESNWFPELREKAPDADQAKMTERYHEEFSRYVGRNDDMDADESRVRASARY